MKSLAAFAMLLLPVLVLAADKVKLQLNWVPEPEFGGIYATHLRNEGDHLVAAVKEALEIGDRAGIPVQLSHHKAEGAGNSCVACHSTRK